MKPAILALAFVLFASVSWANPIAEGAPVSDTRLAKVRGSGDQTAPLLVIIWLPLPLPLIQPTVPAAP